MTRNALYTSQFTAERLLIAALFFAFISVGSASAQIPGGMDCWETEPDTQVDLPPLPPGFFGPGSDPFVGGPIDIEGVPLAGAELDDCVCPPAPGTDVVWVDIHGDPVEPETCAKCESYPV